MSNDTDKFKHSKRLLKDENAVKKQVKIARSHGLTDKDRAIQEPHRMVKHHAMDCGQPGCMLCGNPRKLFKERTQQEKSFYQDLDTSRDTRSNGLKND